MPGDMGKITGEATFERDEDSPCVNCGSPVPAEVAASAEVPDLCLQCFTEGVKEMSEALSEFVETAGQRFVESIDVTIDTE